MSPTMLTPYCVKIEDGDGEDAQHQRDKSGGQAREEPLDQENDDQGGDADDQRVRLDLSKICEELVDLLEEVPLGRRAARAAWAIWPMAMTSARPKTKPVTTDLERKSEMNPRRTIPATSRITPTVRARAAVSARYLAGSAPAMATTTAADITAIVELVVTLSCRLVLKMA